MSSLFTSLRTAVSSLNSIGQGTLLLSENIANANNREYIARRENIADVAGITGGVINTKVVRNTNEFLQNDLWRMTSTSRSDEVTNDLYTRLQIITGAEFGQTILADNIDKLVEAFKSFQAAPEVTASQNEVYFAAQSIVDEFTRLGSEISALRGSIGNEIQASIERVNFLLGDIAKANIDLAKVPKDSALYTNVQNRLDSRLNELAEYFDIRVFRQENDTVLVYTSSSLALVNVVPTEFGWDAETDQLVMKNSGFEVTGAIPEGRLKSQLDFIAKASRTSSGETIDVVNNPDIRLGVLTKYENQLEELARIFMADLSTTGHGDASGNNVFIAAGGASMYATSTATSPHNTLAEIFGNIVYPDQIYIDTGLSGSTLGGLGGGITVDFFADRAFLRDLHTTLEASLADATGDEIDVSRFSDEQRQFFANFLGTGTTVNNHINLDIDDSGIAGGGVVSGLATIGSITAAYRQIGDLLHGIAIPDEQLHIHDLQSFTYFDGTNSVTDTLPTVTDPVTGATDDRFTLSQLNDMILGLETYIDAPGAAGAAGAAGGMRINDLLTSWDSKQQHVFKRLVNKYKPEAFDNTLTTTFYNGATGDPSGGFSLHELTNILNDLHKLNEPPVNPPPGSDITSSLEHYWSDKLFVPGTPSQSDMSDVDFFNIKLNVNALDILDNMRYDSGRLADVLESLTTSTRDFDSGGIEISRQSYSGLSRSLSVHVARRAKEVEESFTRKEELRTNVEISYLNEVGVDIDEEMSRMVILQNSYAATARVISTIDRMFDSLEQALN